MLSTRLEHYKFEHYKLIEDKMRGQSAVAAGLMELERGLRAAEQMGPIGTFFVNDEILTIFGCVIFWKGVGEVWILTTHLVEKYPLLFHKVILHNMEDFWIHFQMHRLQAVVRADHITSRAWMHRLGFIVETMLKEYGPDHSDYLMFAKRSNSHGARNPGNSGVRRRYGFINLWPVSEWPSR